MENGEEMVVVERKKPWWVQKEKEAAARENYGEGEISENWV